MWISIRRASHVCPMLKSALPIAVEANPSSVRSPSWYHTSLRQLWVAQAGVVSKPLEASPAPEAAVKVESIRERTARLNWTAAVLFALVRATSNTGDITQLTETSLQSG